MDMEVLSHVDDESKVVGTTDEIDVAVNEVSVSVYQ